MAQFPTFKYTQNGLDLQHSIEASSGTLRFSKFKLGNGSYSGNIRDLTDIVAFVRNENVTRLKVSGSGATKKVTIGFDLDTTTVTTPFYLKEIGLYAIDPTTNQEVLFLYSNSGETADYISNQTGSGVTTKLINIEIVISDSATITATIDQSVVYALDSDVYKKNEMATVATTGSYSDLVDAPDIPSTITSISEAEIVNCFE